MSITRIGAGDFRPNLSGTGNARGEIDGRFGATLDGLLAKHENQSQRDVERSGELRWSRHATARLEAEASSSMRRPLLRSRKPWTSRV